MALAVAVYSLSARAAQDTTSNTTECLPSCAKQYRSLPGIVISCLTTIFLCIWVSLHLNVPKPVDTRGLGLLRRFKIWIKSFIGCTAVPVFMTLLFPEWVLGMAVLQFIAASRVAKGIDGTRQQGFFIIMGGFHLFKRGQGSSLNESEEFGEEDTIPLVQKSTGEVGGGRRTDVQSKQKFSPFEKDFGEPIHPLDEFDVCRLLKAGKICLPTSAELQDKCKSDGLAKFLVIVQTLWFIAHCIARKISKLPLTELEVITLGYTLLTLSMYIAWWDKPYRVTFPVRVYETLPERTEEQIKVKQQMQEHANFWFMATAYASGTQGGYIDLRSVKQVPMFHSGYNDENNISDILGIITTGIVGTLFGAVHFLAWSSPFPSSHIQYLWRLATIVMSAAPPASLITFLFAFLIGSISPLLGGLIAFGLLPLFLPLYLVGRGVTLVLALVTLATLPLEAYRDVEWSDFFPHI
ncbi:SubName: Full=Uncharacterized protein {ECO:0000313/EMBL:CCA67620.1} [Serendipita indica DSM 11827]|uniref:Uncharacterized protein n=1 Tax=Serendipita indica (strain DSM 11827) TaxID=1109443 RepID=G4T8H7_SERID|nr:SubName: Full=Uncharacterized protein {ECO:0000313/EMBL:CCA67620.1} [Serendipita indica DSM 11827]CCA67620.1 hypothetical protein PIIN_01448 [Serendipita indica DSM 11827]